MNIISGVNRSMWCAFSMVLMLSAVAVAQPTLTVTSSINAASNHEFLVEISPDASLFNPAPISGGSIAAELGFEVTQGSLISASRAGSFFPFDNPGNDPFAGGVTEGLSVNVGGGTVFAAFGSDIFDSSAAVPVLTIEVDGSTDATLTWGGQTLLPGTAFEFVGSRLAQAGVNFDEFMGSVTSVAGPSFICDFDGDQDCDQDDIEDLYGALGTNGGPFDLNNSGIVGPTDIPVWLAAASDSENPAKDNPADIYDVGDANLDGDVDSSDLGLLLNSFGVGNTPFWRNGNFNGDANTDSTDLGMLLNRFGETSALANAVPEPNSLSLMLLLFGAAGIASRRR